MDFSGSNTDAPAKVPSTRRTTAVNKNPSLDLCIAHLRLVFTTDTADIILLRRTNAEGTPARVVLQFASFIKTAHAAVLDLLPRDRVREPRHDSYCSERKSV